VCFCSLTILLFSFVKHWVFGVSMIIKCAASDFAEKSSGGSYIRVTQESTWLVSLVFEQTAFLSYDFAMVAN